MRWMPNPGEPSSYPSAGAEPAGSVAEPAGARRRQIGETVGGRYRLDRLLSRSDRTETWAATHLELQRAVAVKLLRPGLGDLAEQMLAGARALARIHHPHVIEFSDVGRDADGAPYFVIELLRGQTLAELLAERGAVAWARAVQIVQQIGAALDAAQQQGVIHRDLRPEHVFLVDSGEPGDFIKLMDFGVDFGVARRPRDGSPGYMSPEQCRGEQLDPRSEVYSIGCLLYAMVTGEAPFLGEAKTVRWRQINEAPRPMRELAPRQFIPEELEAIVARCLDKSPARRFVDPRELAAELAEIANFAAATSVSGGVIPRDGSGRPMTFRGWPALEDERAQAIEQRPATPPAAVVVEREASSVGTIVAMVFGGLLAVAGAGLGVWWLVTRLISSVPEAAGPEAAGAEAAGAEEAARARAASLPAKAPAEAAANDDPADRGAKDPSGAEEPAAPEDPSGVEAPAEASAKASDKAAVAGPKSTEAQPDPGADPDVDKPSMEPQSKANAGIGHEDLADPWN